ncbi:hypothetical protein BGY98DRAFT_1099508 [Russula aff. rugulosa BPL654]|nr:hypothetical protein BGY98DRAFT_1099508 [Russula aff. rugulosa BPL654]
MSEPDYPNMLNNLLQGHPGGNVSCHLRYTFTQEGPDGNATHFATAKFREQGYGVGEGKTKGVARWNAAKATYELFSTTGVPGM